jgi:ribosomal-protein-alanine N-acetyltransferase
VGKPAADCEIIFAVDSSSYNVNPAEDRLTSSQERNGGLEGVVVREARLADVEAIIALEREAETAAHWREDEYRKLFAGGGVQRVGLVLEAQGRVSGFIVTADVGGEWELENIVVARASRGRGIGSRLMRAFVNVARERAGRAVFLEVRESNVPAREFYRKWGFEEVGGRKRYYSGPEEDGVVYRLELAGE